MKEKKWRGEDGKHWKQKLLIMQKGFCEESTYAYYQKTDLFI